MTCKNKLKKRTLLSLASLGFAFNFFQLSASEGNFSYFPEEPWLANYLSEMPWQHYSSYYVKDLAWFWVDSAKDCVKDTIKEGKIWEPYIIYELIQYIKPGDSVIDIGAHIGTISMAMSNLVGAEGKVYSFEGERQFFRELWHNIYSNGRKNIFPHLCWLSDHNEDIFFYSYYPEEYSPVATSNDKKPWPLKVRTLDSFNFKNIGLIKMDVECTEDQVLAGALKTIECSRPVIIIEIMGGFGLSSDPVVHEKINNTLNTLLKLNYSVTKILIDDYLAVPNERL